MNTATILELVKARIGISTTVRDAYLTAIIEATVKELEDEKGINLNPENMSHVMFVVNYSEWRYSNRDSSKGLPRSLQWDLQNLYIHSGGKEDVQS